MFGCLRDCAGESVLDCLQAPHLRRVDVVEKRITVIELAMNNSGGYCARGLVTKYWRFTTEVANVHTAGVRWLAKVRFFINDVFKIETRRSIRHVRSEICWKEVERVGTFVYGKEFRFGWI